MKSVALGAAFALLLITAYELGRYNGVEQYKLNYREYLGELERQAETGRTDQAKSNQGSDDRVHA